MLVIQCSGGAVYIGEAGRFIKNRLVKLCLRSGRLTKPQTDQHIFFDSVSGISHYISITDLSNGNSLTSGLFYKL